MALVRFGSYNLFNLFGTDSAVERDRYQDVVEVIRGLDADVLAVQEIIADDGALAARRLATLADDTGLRCAVPGGRPALALGRHGFHTALLWRPGMDVRPDSLEVYGTPDFWHSLVMLTFDVGGRAIRHACYHATPFSRQQRTEQADRVLSLLVRPPDRPPALVAADWNGVGADRRPDGGYYDHDPFVGEWQPQFVHHAEWSYDSAGRRLHRADRQAGDLLYAGGLRDAAAVLDVPWESTVGHYPTDSYPERRIDTIRVTDELVPALRGHETIRTEPAPASSDHLPVVVSYDPAALDTTCT